MFCLWSYTNIKICVIVFYKHRFNYCIDPGPEPCDKTVFDIACQIMVENGWGQPLTHEEGIVLFENLRQEIRRNL